MKRIAVLLLLAAACRQKAEPPPSEEREEVGPRYRVDVQPPASCAAGVTCRALVQVEALGRYEINEKYKPSFQSTDKSVQAKFERQTSKRGTLTLEFAADETKKIDGTFKIGLCNGELCRTESPKIELVVPVT